MPSSIPLVLKEEFEIDGNEEGHFRGVKSELPVKLEPHDSSPEPPEVIPNFIVKCESQETTSDTSTVKRETHDTSSEVQDVKPVEVRVKTEPLEDASRLKNELQEIKNEFEGSKNETFHIKPEQNHLQKVKCELVGQDASNGLMIESTSSLCAEAISDIKTLVPKREGVSTNVKDERIEKLKIENEPAEIANSERPRRACRRIDYTEFGDSGNDEYVKKFDQKSTKVRERFKSDRPKAVVINPKWRVKTESMIKCEVSSPDPRKVVNGVERVKTKITQPSCETSRSKGETDTAETEVPEDHPVVWVKVEEEVGFEDEQEEEINFENAELKVENPDWQIDEDNNGMDLLRNINMIFSKSIKTEGGGGVSNHSTVVRGRQKLKMLKTEELLEKLMGDAALSADQAELLVVLRSRMDFSDPPTLSYWDGLKYHICLVCAYKTHVPAHMVKHIRCHTGDKQYVCAECDYRCVENSAMAAHRRTHTGEKPYSCPHCDYRTNGSQILKTHIMIHTGKKPLSCPHCDFKCREHGGLKRHIRIHTGEKPFACPHCDYRGPSSSCLKSHIKVHTKEKPYVCSYCEYATACSSSLTIHLRRHTGEKPYSCSVCSYKFVSSGTLKVHMRTHTGEKPFLCKTCGYRCATHGRYKAHTRIHSGDKKHECPFCDYKSVRSDNLKMHLRTHTGERPYHCPHCEYRSSEKARVVQHIRVHTGEKPYVCSTCGFKTGDQNGLRSHSRIHLVEKPFCCSYCQYKTTRREILKTHIMRHTGVKPYSCPYCPYKCIKSCSLKGHVANNHTGNKKLELL
ncbi:hypothetical protein GE061_017026 [Apolygus lucorum]|uniref:C2H2-type domain-containing protein n=1 Tax=Apolygus lucorum TaxID=248454 RepID=A0A8S9XJY7_APOLU|nr:hypothetical protein GE061_017026 [Apolygus lucorum]